jgi:hypothetical protein
LFARLRAISHYDEPTETLAHTISTIKAALPPLASTWVTIYNKKLDSAQVLEIGRVRREAGADEVVLLSNVGREGETYLVRRYGLVGWGRD